MGALPSWVAMIAVPRRFTSLATPGSSSPPVRGVAAKAPKAGRAPAQKSAPSLGPAPLRVAPRCSESRLREIGRGLACNCERVQRILDPARFTTIGSTAMSIFRSSFSNTIELTAQHGHNGARGASSKVENPFLARRLARKNNLKILKFVELKIER